MVFFMDRRFALLINVISFAELRKKNFIYIDKTAKLKNLIRTGQKYFLAHPKCFEKILTLSTLTAM